MTSILLSRSNEEAKELVREAFRRTEGITQIQEGGRQIVGKTGINFPRVLWSWGENVYVDFSDTGSDDETQLDVWAEKEVWMNITASPEEHKRRFLSELEVLKDTPTEEISESSQKLSRADESQKSTEKLIAMVIVGALTPMFLVMLVGSSQPDNTASGIWSLLFLIGPIIGAGVAYTTWNNSDTTNTSRLSHKVGYTIVGALGFSILGVLLGIRIFPARYPALGILTIGGAIGFGAADEKDLPLPKRGVSILGYVAFSYLGGLLFPPPGTRLQSNTFMWAIFMGMVGGAVAWYFLRNHVIADAFE